MRALRQLLAEALPGEDTTEYLKELAQARGTFAELVASACESGEISEADAAVLLGGDTDAVRQRMSGILRDAKEGHR
jgi:hypothetical protein